MKINKNEMFNVIEYLTSTEQYRFHTTLSESKSLE